MKRKLLLSLPVFILACVFYFFVSKSFNTKDPVEIKTEEIESSVERELQTPLSKDKFYEIRNELKQLHGDFDYGVTSWVSLGPNGYRINNNPGRLFSGKVTSLDIQGTDIVLGSAGGGLWKNFFITWIDLSMDLPILRIGSIAMNPANHDIMLTGTGEASQLGGSGFGIGMFRTTNGGENWFSTFFLSGSPQPTAFSRIIFNYNNPDTVHCASDAGYFRSTNNGVSWYRGFSGPATDIQIDPVNPQILYAVFGDGNFGSGGVYKSTNGGSNWNRFLDQTLPPNDYGNGAISVCKSSPSQLYLYLTKRSTYGAHGVYRSTNGGLNWTNVNLPANAISALGTQGAHAYCCTVSPGTPQIAMIGGVKMIRTSDGGMNWSIFDIGQNSSAPHDDIQNFAWSNNKNVYVATDGGIYYSSDTGTVWTSSANTMPITDFNDVSSSPQNTYDLLAGAEHNGFAHYYNNGGGYTWYYRGGADGGDAQIDPANRQILYGINGDYGGTIPFKRNRSTNGGLSWSVIDTGISPSSGCGQWYPSVASSRLPTPFQNTLYSQVCKTVYKSTNQGTNWINLNCPVVSTSWFIDEHITVTWKGDVYCSTTRNDQNATSNKLWVYLIGSGTWADRTPTTSFSNNRLKRVSEDMNSEFTIYAVYEGVNNPTAKVIKSTNKGVTWRNITGTGLADAPMLEVVANPRDTNILYAATETFGVFVTTNGGNNWYPHSSGLPQGVMIKDIELSDSTSQNQIPPVLFLATYGRGIYMTNLDPNPIGVVNQTSDVSDFRLSQNYPNPFNPATIIDFDLPKNQNVQLGVYDITGRLIMMLENRPMKAGSHSVKFSNPGLPSGVYFYSLVTDSFRDTKKMILVK